MSGPQTQERSYADVRAERRREKKASKKARKAAKPKGIDFPIWKAMPLPLLIVFLATVLVGLVTIAVVLISPPQPKIAVAERRSPPGPSVSHYVGPILLAPLPSSLPATKPPCNELSGVVIEGGAPAQVRLGGVMKRMCPFLTDRSPFAQSVRALRQAHIRFARFARTGDPSTLSLQSPVRVLVNVRFARRDQSALYIAPLLAHEGFHLLHRAERFTAALELQAREVELRACRLLIDVRGWPRGCHDAQQLIDFGHSRAIRALADAGFPE
ncbi:MAG: hypothetical protein NVSMB57_01590 [Actinomycetota bacterium]